jgi:hypothetical protein
VKLRFRIPGALLSLCALGLGVVLIASISVGLLRASDHDDGELDTKGRNVNLTDLYVFREIDQNPNANAEDLVFIMNTNPRSLYQQYYFSTNARYEFKIARVSDNENLPVGKADVTLRFEFGLPDSAGRQNVTVTAIADKTTRFARATVGGAAIRTTPLNTPPLLNQVSLLGSTLTVFAGLREDSFFFDVEQYFRVRAGLLGLGPKVGFRKPGLDFAAGYGVNSIVVRVPRSFLQGKTTVTTFDVWETISVKQGGTFKQVERLARPAINEGLLVNQEALALFNRISPDEDLKPVAASVRAEAARTLAAVGNSPERINALVGAFLPDVMRIDTTGPSGYANALNSRGSPIRGRKITDDVIDITLSVLTNGAVTGDNVSYAGPNLGGVGHQPLLPDFPYLADMNPPGSATDLPTTSDNQIAENGFSVQEILASVSSDSVQFQALGSGLQRIQVQVFDLNGKPVFDSGFVAGSRLVWNLSHSRGEQISVNGAYFYVLTAQGQAGNVVRSGLRKLALIR